MTPLSAKSCPLSSLHARASELRPHVHEQLAAGLITPLPAALNSRYWSLVAKLGVAAQDVPYVFPQLLSLQEATVDRCFEQVKGIMHEMASLTEYLGKVLSCVIQSDSKKNKPAQQAKARLDTVVERDFKVPINLIKHAGFNLTYTGRFKGDEHTGGFYLNGLIAPNTSGSAHFLKHKGKSTPVAKATSFAWFLRQCLPVYFELCAITEQALDDAGLFEKRIGSPASPVVAPAHWATLQEALAALRSLPTRGFPDEQGRRVPQLVLNGSMLAVANTFLLRGCNSSEEFSHVFQPPEVGEVQHFPYGGDCRAMPVSASNFPGAPSTRILVLQSPQSPPA